MAAVLHGLQSTDLKPEGRSTEGEGLSTEGEGLSTEGEGLYQP